MLFSNKCLAQVTLNKFETDFDNFDISQSEAFSGNFGLSQSISGYLVISQRTISG